MTNMENWVNKNSEVETEDKENGAVVLTGAADEQIVENENTSDDIPPLSLLPKWTKIGCSPE